MNQGELLLDKNVLRVLFIGMFLLFCCSPVWAQVYYLSEQQELPPGVSLLERSRQIRIRDVGAVPVKPDTIYLLMRVSSENGQLARAIEENQQSVDRFKTALKQLAIPESAMRLSNFVVMPADPGPGFSFSRNLVITLEAINQKPDEQIHQLVAKVQDLGAQFGSECITCIGSG